MSTEESVDGGLHSPEAARDAGRRPAVCGEAEDVRGRTAGFRLKQRRFPGSRYPRGEGEVVLVEAESERLVVVLGRVRRREVIAEQVLPDEERVDPAEAAADQGIALLVGEP